MKNKIKRIKFEPLYTRNNPNQKKEKEKMKKKK